MPAGRPATRPSTRSAIAASPAARGARRSCGGRPRSGRASSSSGRASAARTAGPARSPGGGRGSRAGRRRRSCVSSITSTTLPPVRARRSKNAVQAANRSSRAKATPVPDAQQHGEPRPEPRRARPASGTNSARPASSFSSHDVAGVGVDQPEPAADHLGQRPEGDAVAVGQAAAAVPAGRRAEPVDVLLELPGQPGLADPGRAVHGDQPRRRVSSVRVEQLLDQAQLVVRGRRTAPRGRRPAGRRRRRRRRRRPRTAGPARPCP